jgi:hypothetical protein
MFPAVCDILSARIGDLRSKDHPPKCTCSDAWERSDLELVEFHRVVKRQQPVMRHFYKFETWGIFKNTRYI